MRVWGFIPARGKSKNMTDVCGRPLIDYCIERAFKSKRLERIYCSSDDPDILQSVSIKGVIRRDLRPKCVSDPDTPIDEVVIEFIERHPFRPQAICLIQPTSPFFRPKDIDKMIRMLNFHKEASSIQTICKVPHAFHAWNQRYYEGNRVRFCFPDMRAIGYNKQHKPPLWRFGNLVITRTDILLKGRGFFAEPSIGLRVPWREALDVDTGDDFEMMRMMLNDESSDSRR